MNTSGKVETITPANAKPNPASNPDPITGAPYSHPVETAVGSASGAGAGALAGAAIGGPIGAIAGAVAGAVIGGVGGHAVGEAIDPTVELSYWRTNYNTRPYYKQGRAFEDYEPAYRYGWENAMTRREATFEEAEKADLSAGWLAARGTSREAWEDVRDASRDAWAHARTNHKQ